MGIQPSLFLSIDRILFTLISDEPGVEVPLTRHSIVAEASK